jgi:hypothetical protein
MVCFVKQASRWNQLEGRMYWLLVFTATVAAFICWDPPIVPLLLCVECLLLYNYHRADQKRKKQNNFLCYCRHRRIQQDPREGGQEGKSDTDLDHLQPLHLTIVEGRYESATRPSNFSSFLFLHPDVPHQEQQWLCIEKACHLSLSCRTKKKDVAHTIWDLSFPALDAQEEITGYKRRNTRRIVGCTRRIAGTSVSEHTSMSNHNKGRLYCLEPKRHRQTLPIGMSG